jgi:hypothetical protein
MFAIIWFLQSWPRWSSSQKKKNVHSGSRSWIAQSPTFLTQVGINGLPRECRELALSFVIDPDNWGKCRFFEQIQSWSADESMSEWWTHLRNRSFVQDIQQILLWKDQGWLGSRVHLTSSTHIGFKFPHGFHLEKKIFCRCKWSGMDYSWWHGWTVKTLD